VRNRRSTGAKVTKVATEGASVNNSSDESGPPYTSGFNPQYKDRKAECDGGAAVPGTHFAGRQEFAGTLTGSYRDFGSYPWRWYLLTELTLKPNNYPYDSVWCDEGNLFLQDSR
jgi:hypothetical protein